MAGGTGNDTYYVDNANDVVDETGGDGIDLVYSSRGFSLGNAATALGGIENLTLTGTGSNSGTGNGLDNAITGGSGDNLLKGMDGSDTLKGNDGNDQLLGGNGDDTLTGGNGTDQLTGNVGADKLTGGADADTFFFLSVKDSTVASTGRDTIVDFSSGQGDKIDLSAIDARTDLAGDQAFSFISFAAFSHTAGELRIAASGANLVVSGDTNGDAAADFSILLKNVATASATDFVL
jgi:serralysin